MHVDDVEAIVNPATDTLYNGSFEYSQPNPILPDGWLIEGDATGWLSDAFTRDGNLSFKVTQTAGQLLNLTSTPFTVRAGRQIRVWYSVKRDAAADFAIHIIWHRTSGSIYADEFLELNSGVLANFADFRSIPIIVPAPATNAEIQFQFDAPAGTTNTYLDRVIVGEDPDYIDTVSAFPYTVNADFGGADVTTGGTNRTVALPAAATVGGQQFLIKKVDSGVGTLTIDPSGSETIDGASTLVLTTQNESALVQSDGTNWFVKAYYAGTQFTTDILATQVFR
jgi:hypothetical protein